MFYSNQIFRDAGLSGNEPSYATLAMGAIFVAQTFVSVWLVRPFPDSLCVVAICPGRPSEVRSTLPSFDRPRGHVLFVDFYRFLPLTFRKLWSADGGLFYTLEAKKADGSMSHPWAAYASILFVLLFVVSFATGPGEREKKQLVRIPGK